VSQATVVQALLEGQEVLRSRLPAQRGVVPKKGAVTWLHKAAERGDATAILDFADRPEFINARLHKGGRRWRLLLTTTDRGP
jgi:hypothetical protein